jgi:hypothetical protein
VVMIISDEDDRKDFTSAMIGIVNRRCATLSNSEVFNE